MNRIVLSTALGLASLALAGCGHQAYYAPPPPPVAYVNQTPPLIQAAQQNGYQTGYDDGSRDSYYRAGYAPRRDRKFQDAPGYDYRLGPLPPYVSSFREAYLHGYETGFYRR